MDLVPLRDGRELEVYVSGAAGAPPLIYHHGTPGAATPIVALERAAHAAGLRYVTFSRPGFGRSTRSPGRAVADVWGDVADLLEWLDAPHCVTAGWSGGGPYALATAAALPKNVAGCLVISGLAQYGQPDLDWFAGMGEQNVESSRMAIEGDEPALRELLKDYAAPENYATTEAFVELWPTLIPGRDRRALRSELGTNLAQQMGDGLVDSVDGWLDDMIAIFRPWRFTPEEIRPPVLLWQGGNDLIVPHDHWLWLSRHLPTAQPRLLTEDGHFSVTAEYAGEMVAQLASYL